MKNNNQTEAHQQDVIGLRQTILLALDLKYKGNPTPYLELIRELTDRNLAPERQIILYQALAQSVSVLSKRPDVYHALIHTLFQFDWDIATEEVASAFVEFLCHLVSANGTYCLPSLQLVVKQFVPKLVPKRGGDHTPESDSDNMVTIEPKPQVMEAFKKLVELAPSASSLVYPILIEHFPHKRLAAPIQTGYLSYLLLITEVLPSLQDRILALIIDKLLVIDVEIKLDEAEEDMFTMDDFLDDNAPGPQAIDEMADKLDQMMVILFEYMERKIQENSAHASRLFRYLLRVFDRAVLNTHRSKYPQYLLFYLGQFNPELPTIFVTQLLGAALEPRAPPTTRQSCVAYLASFLSRAKYIPLDMVKSTLIHLMKWMKAYVDEYDQSPAATPPERMFYVIFQSACYIVCYRGLELMQSKGGCEFLQSFPWNDVVRSHLNPMAFCLPSIANEFLNLMDVLPLVDDEWIVRWDNYLLEKSALEPPAEPQSGSNLERTKKADASQRNPLHMFFPFDPYLLRRSYKYIGPLFRYWKHADPLATENHDAVDQIREFLRQDEDASEAEEMESIASSIRSTLSISMDLQDIHMSSDLAEYPEKLSKMSTFAVDVFEDDYGF